MYEKSYFHIVFIVIINPHYRLVLYTVFKDYYIENYYS